MPPKRKKLSQPPNKKMAETLTNVDVEMSHGKVSCENCSKSYFSAAGLKRHKKCCDKKIKQETAVQEDEWITDTAVDEDELNAFIVQKPAFTCNECNKKFKYKDSYLKHLALEHSDSPDSVRCDQCSARCPTAASLEEHINKTHNRDVYECPHCKKTFTRSYHVKRHLEQMGCSNSNGPLKKSFNCEICNMVFTRKDNLMIHLRLHLRNKSYKCKLCPYETHNHRKLMTHTRDKHLGKIFQCDLCGKITKSRMAIAKHLKIHGEKKLACDVCGYMTHTLEVMQRHVLRHTSDKPFKCPQCPSSFIQAGQLRTHMAKHDGNICNHCGDHFPSRYSLHLHLRTHEGLDPLLCPYTDCKNAKLPFAYEEAFRKHLLVHSDRTYTCKLCSKKFHVKTNLLRHMTIHTLDRPRRCMYCMASRAYIRGEMLARHVRLRHPDLFKEHLASVRKVLGFDKGDARVRKCEIESIILRLDALENHILQESRLGQDLYGGIEFVTESKQQVKTEPEESPLMSEEELAQNLGKLLSQLIDEKTLKYFGWPEESVDEVLEKVIEQCGQRAADRNRWSRVQCLRENTKHLFLHVIEDKTISKMLATHTIDQVVRHILNVSQ